MTASSLPANPRVNSLILAAGVGTRLKPLSDHVSKCLVDVCGRPLLSYWLDALLAIGTRDALVNTHAHAGQVRDFIARHNSRGGGLVLRESHEAQLVGSAGTVAANPDLADGASEVVIIYADNFSTVDLNRMLEFHRQHRHPCTMLLFKAPDPKACGIAELDRDSTIVDFVEKPNEPVSDLANAGVYVVDADLYREIAALQAFDFGFDVLPRLIGRMAGFVHDGYHLDIGNPAAYQQACRDARDLLKERGQTAGGVRPAVFLDRDGTLIESVHYLDRPEQVALVADCGASLRRLRQAGFALVVVTNQAAIGKGIITEQDLLQIHHHFHDLLAHQGVGVDAIYHCSQPGVGRDRNVIEHPNRKPGPGMLQEGALDAHLDLDRSYMVGDVPSDVLAGYYAGCRQNLLLQGSVAAGDEQVPSYVDYVGVPDLKAAADWIVKDATAPLATGRGLLASRPGENSRRL